MVASIIDGKHVALQIKNKLRAELEEFIHQGFKPPGLAVILLGDDSSSAIYVNGKRKACSHVGFESFSYNLPTSTTEDELLTLIDTLNHNEDVDGILVQLPLPKHIDAINIIEHISPKKDVDGFHPFNFGRLAQGNPLLRPCTPYGVIQLLQYYDIPIKGRDVVIIGASNIVGRPMALEFLALKATVTVCHSKTNDLEKHVRMADILVSATGVLNITNPQWLNENQVIIDIGMHRVNGKVCGDINFDEVKNKVAWITPVPFGVGPMTIATLLQNTMLSWKKKNNIFDSDVSSI
ncbi:MAG: bifunctional methylenetetrahydrofolate dehydrogenase/methenyltetrahydrofolate cyclohydrolase FolD [Legionellaceae bacterium]|nr:bifunctional methylenetetrahydrofolate dehydrogenase/methenyltetrahydrofolate cyclohydrolase FolD [Legionellaceae bacterium]